MVKEIRGRSGAGSVPVHGLAPQNLSPDTHVDVCADSDEDRGSTPLASTFALRAKVSAVALAKAEAWRRLAFNIYNADFASYGSPFRVVFNEAQKTNCCRAPLCQRFDLHSGKLEVSRRNCTK